MVHSFIGNRSAKIGTGLILTYVTFMLVTPLVIHYSPNYPSGRPNLPPNSAHLLGTDFLGHDVLTQTAYGAYISIPIGLITAIATVVIGLLVGVFAGFYSRLEGLLTGVADVIMTFPALALLILLGSIYPPTNLTIILMMVAVLWPPVARSIRSQVLSLKKMPFVDAANTSGLSKLAILRTVIIPEVASIAFAYFVLTVALAIVLISALQFLGIGNPNEVSWGSMLYFAQQFAFYDKDWWWILAPGLSITIVAMAFALIGFSVEEVMNPRLK